MFLFDSSVWFFATVLEAVVKWLICLLFCVQGWGGLLLHPEGSSGIQKHHQILQTQWLWWSGEAPEGAGAGGPEGFLFFHIASLNVQQDRVATPLVPSHTWMSKASSLWWSVQGAGGQALRRFLYSRTGLGCPLEITEHSVASKRITFYVCVTVLMSISVSPAESP